MAVVSTVLEETLLDSDSTAATAYAIARDGWTSLAVAAWKGQESVVARLLSNGATDDNVRGFHGSTMLFYAADGGHRGVVDQLVSHGIDPNACDDDGQTALFCAVERGKFDVVLQLLLLGCQQEIKDNNGNTALDWAAQKRQWKIFYLLKQTQAASREELDHVESRFGIIQ